MLFFILFIISILIFVKLFVIEKIHVDLQSFLKKGFAKLDDKFGLYCYTGKQGKGKTYSAIKFLIEQKIKNDYIIITNVSSFNYFTDTLYFEKIEDMIDFVIEHEYDKQKYIVFFDEIFTILEKKTAMNKKILSFLSQLRKRKILFVTTAQEWSEINITFRRYCRFQIACNMFELFGLAFIYNAINDGDQIRWNNDLQEFEAPRVAANFAKCNKYIIDSYNTFETIKT